MSSNTYTLKIDIDDSKIRELEKRLMAVMGGKTAGLSGLAGAATGKGGDKSALMNNIKKLGIIALGVGSLVALVQKLAGMIVDSSPMLKGMLKLLNYSVMLILRPIGDFFGFFLRPIVIYFLRSVALPFYKQMRPIMQALGTYIGMEYMTRQTEIDSVGGKAAWEEGFTHEDGMKNLEQTLLQWGSLFSIFEEGETQYQSTKDAIAAFKGAFTAIDGFTIPDLNTTWLDTWVKDNLSIDKFPTLDISAIQTKIASAISELTPSFDISGIQDKLNTAIAGITDYDFESLMTTVGNKIKSIWDGIFEKIFEFLPFLRPEETTTTSSSTQITNPYWSDSMNQAVNNNNNQAEEDPITAGFNWIVGGINEQIKGWTG